MVNDYIKREDAIEYLVDNMVWMDADGIETNEEDKRDAIAELINGVPSADVAPVVRCKNCKHFRTFHTASDGEEIRLCVGRGIVDLYYDDFCSKAERKDDD